MFAMWPWSVRVGVEMEEDDSLSQERRSPKRKGKGADGHWALTRL